MRTRLVPGRSRFSQAASLAVSMVVAVACGSSRDDGFQPSPDGGGPAGPGGTGLGEVKCVNERICVDDFIFKCGPDGKPTDEKLGECTNADEACSNGVCVTGCEAAATKASNIGCEFWAVDLDQEVNGLNNAAAAPWGVVISNPGGGPADVTIEQNDAPPGQPAALKIVKQLTILGGKVETIVMPTRELDGSSQGKNDGPGTFLSSNAFRITSNYPVVAYQLNALAQAYSNDGSLLIPRGGLGKVHRVLTWPTPAIAFAGIVNRPYITVVGVSSNTHVHIRSTIPTVTGSGVPALAANGEVDITLNPFDVFNLEGDGPVGDFSGSVVTSDQPIAVFVGSELSIAPSTIPSDFPTPPSGGSGSCCQDHLEEQLFPVESYGKKFAIPHSAVRSKGGWIEPDMIRIMGVAATAGVTTNLPPPNDQMVLSPGEVRELWTQKDFVVESSEPIAVAQVLISGERLEGALTGDPSLTTFPAVDQFRKNYLFSSPTSWNLNYVVVTMPKGTKVTIDGKPTDGCTSTNPSMGTIEGVEYVARTCPLEAGPHLMEGDQPFGIVAYGYGTAGSYAFVGGANVKKIYTPPQIK